MRVEKGRYFCFYIFEHLSVLPILASFVKYNTALYLLLFHDFEISVPLHHSAFLIQRSRS